MSSSDVAKWGSIAGVVLAVYFVFKYVVTWLAGHWIPIAIILGVLVAGAVTAIIVFKRRHPNTDQAVALEVERHVGHVDEMTTRQFDAWVGNMLIESGMRKVRMKGHKADFGCDFLATGPDAKRIVVRAKHDDGTMSRRGARHIQALGMDAHARWQADMAVLITNADLHRTRNSARHDTLANQLGVTLVDRVALASWIADREPPPAIPATPYQASEA